MKTMAKAIDITGQNFNGIQVIERDLEEEKRHTSKGSTYWKCKCYCGNTFTTLRSSLISGKTKSCGCLRKKVSKIHMHNLSSNNFIDETGHKYGKLTVICKVENNSNRKGVLWKCVCDCGNEKDVIGSDLRNGTVSSCGCIGKSKGEYLIEQLLDKNEINFIKEYPQFINNIKMRFDFAIFNNDKIAYFIEFDGEQHYRSSDLFGGDAYFEYIKNHDILKNEWCKNNNYPIIRIPYHRYPKLTIQDLRLETSKYILK